MAPSLRYGAILLMALPATLTYISTPLAGVIDTYVIAQLNKAHLIGGLALGGVLFDLVFVSFNFLRAVTTGLVAQTRRDSDALLILLRACFVAIVLGVVVVLVREPVASYGSVLLGAEGEVQTALLAYFTVRCLSAPLMLTNYAMLGFLLGKRQTGSALLIQAVQNLCNIGLSIWFVIGNGWAVAGVAWATVIAELVAVSLGFVVIGRRISHPIDWSKLMVKAQWRQLFSMNFNMWVRTMCLVAAFAYFANRSASLGPVILAANAILEKLISLSAYFLDGVATVTEQLVGHAVGRQSKRRIRLAIINTLKVGFVIAAGLSAFWWLSADWTVLRMTDSPAIVDALTDALWWFTWVPIFGLAAYILDGAFIGAAWGRPMRTAMIQSLLFFLAIAWGFTEWFGNAGLWAALLLFFVIRALALSWQLRIKLQADSQR
ncbi:MAG: MATE family efflux transporter [Gammaproteobacteria bacterium]|nr:MATE family efflux transporter [Gammaproteobacteria bacterium]